MYVHVIFHIDFVSQYSDLMINEVNDGESSELCHKDIGDTKWLRHWSSHLPTMWSY